MEPTFRKKSIFIAVLSYVQSQREEGSGPVPARCVSNSVPDIIRHRTELVQRMFRVAYTTSKFSSVAAICEQAFRHSTFGRFIIYQKS